MCLAKLWTLSSIGLSGIDFVHINENQYQDFPKKHAHVRYAQNYTEIVLLDKIPTPGN